MASGRLPLTQPLPRARGRGKGSLNIRSHSRSHRQTPVSRGAISLLARREIAAELQVPPPRQLDERPPDGARQREADQEVPEPVRPLVEVRHRQVRRHRAPVARAGAARSSGARRAAGSTRRSPPPVARGVMCFGPEDDVRRVVAASSPCAAAGPRPPSGGTAACRDRASGCGTSRTPAGSPRSTRPSARRRPGRSWSKPSTKLPFTWMPWSCRMRDAPRVVVGARASSCARRRGSRPCSDSKPTNTPVQPASAISRTSDGSSVTSIVTAALQIFSSGRSARQSRRR